LSKPIEFGDWRLGPLSAFEDLWNDAKFKAQAQAFLRKFVDSTGGPIDKPGVLCRRNTLAAVSSRQGQRARYCA
jgi:hypothetical protein